MGFCATAQTIPYEAPKFRRTFVFPVAIQFPPVLPVPHPRKPCMKGRIIAQQCSNSLSKRP
jgi:hypothetical protein